MKVFRVSAISALIPSTLLGFIWPFLVSSEEVANWASWFFFASTTFTVLLLVSLIATDDEFQTRIGNIVEVM